MGNLDGSDESGHEAHPVPDPQSLQNLLDGRGIHDVGAERRAAVLAPADRGARCQHRAS